MPRRIRRAAVVAVGLLLAACSSAPVPDVAYYRMPAPAGVTARETPLFRTPVLVETFYADGLHAQQAILYALRPGGGVRAYHYQLWSDPPGRLLQRRLIRTLREGNAAELVTARLSSALAAVRVIGVVERFARVQTDAGWVADVEIELRVDERRDDLPLMLRTYAATVPAESASIEATVRAFATATDEVYARFLADLEALER